MVLVVLVLRVDIADPWCQSLLLLFWMIRCVVDCLMCFVEMFLGVMDKILNTSWRKVNNAPRLVCDPSHPIAY
jgi:hypothetical protein